LAKSNAWRLLLAVFVMISIIEELTTPSRLSEYTTRTKKRGST